MAAGTHWTTWPEDPFVKQTKMYSAHINRPRIGSETIYKLLELKSKMTGTKLDILAESEKFEAQQMGW